MSEVRSLRSDIFNVTQAHTLDSERRRFNTVVPQTPNGPRASEGDKYLHDLTTEKTEAPTLDPQAQVLDISRMGQAHL